MTGATIAGILITDLILGKKNPWAAAYSPSRLLPLAKSTLSGLGEEVSHTVQGYKDFIPMVGTDSVDIEDLMPHSGCVVQQGLKKVAAYRDGDGNIHKYSRTYCPSCQNSVTKCSQKYQIMFTEVASHAYGSIISCLQTFHFMLREVPYPAYRSSISCFRKSTTCFRKFHGMLTEVSFRA